MREFALRLDAPVDEVLEHCAERGIAAGVPLGEPSTASGLLVAITEQRLEADIDRLADVLGEAVAARPASGQPAEAGVA